MRRFPISYSAWMRLLAWPFGLGPKHSAVAVADGRVRVEMGGGFGASFPVSAVRSAVPETRRVLSRGVHGWRGRWTVNGSGRGLVRIELQPAQRAHVLGVSVSLRELLVSVDDPQGLVDALGGGRGSAA